MCGIAGIYNFDKNENILDDLLKMLNKLQIEEPYGICFKQLKGNLHKIVKGFNKKKIELIHLQ